MKSNSGDETPPGGASSGKSKAKAKRKATAKKPAVKKAEAKPKAAAKKPAVVKPPKEPKQPKAAAAPKKRNTVPGLPHINQQAQDEAERNGPRALRTGSGSTATRGLSSSHAVIYELAETLREMCGQAKNTRYRDWERSIGVIE